VPYDVFDADLGERHSNGRSSSVRPSSVLCESRRRFLSVYGWALQKRLSTRNGQLPKNWRAHGCRAKRAVR